MFYFNNEFSSNNYFHNQFLKIRKKVGQILVNFGKNSNVNFWKTVDKEYSYLVFMLKKNHKQLSYCLQWSELFDFIFINHFTKVELSPKDLFVFE